MPRLLVRSCMHARMIGSKTAIARRTALGREADTSVAILAQAILAQVALSTSIFSALAILRFLGACAMSWIASFYNY